MDWGSVAERAQFAIIGATGVAALYVANRQLAAFNRNELVRNTLKVLDDCRQPTTLRDLSISPLNAAARVNQVASDPAERPQWPPKMYHLWPLENVPGVGGHLKVYHP